MSLDLADHRQAMDHMPAIAGDHRTGVHNLVGLLFFIVARFAAVFIFSAIVSGAGRLRYSVARGTHGRIRFFHTCHLLPLSVPAPPPFIRSGSGKIAVRCKFPLYYSIIFLRIQPRRLSGIPLSLWNFSNEDHSFGAISWNCAKKRRRNPVEASV